MIAQTPASSQRYARQQVLAEIGNAGQEALARARVLVVGAGGLGSPVLLYLAAAGVGQKNAGGAIGIIDDDVVDTSNLQRQILFREADQGCSKAANAAQQLTALNSDVELKVLAQRLNADNVLAIFSNYDIIIDGSDNFDTKFLVNDAAVRLGLPVVYGSILGFEGQASVFWAEHGPCYRCLYPAPPESYVPNCAEFGTLGGIAGFIGSVQAVEACKLALGLPHCRDQALEPLIGHLLLSDARNWDIRKLRIEKNPDCPVCSLTTDAIEMPGLTTSACETPTPKNLSMADLNNLLESGIPFTLLDVREAAEWANGHLEGAQHLPLGQLLTEPTTLELLDSSQTLIVYCQHGIRSQTAVRFLHERGYNALNLIVHWP